MTKLVQELSLTMRAEWDSEDGLLTITHRPTQTLLSFTPSEQVGLIRLVETIIEKDLDIGKGT